MQPYLPFAEVRQSLEFINYQQAARCFCSFVEHNNCLATVEFLDTTRSRLLQLYASALAMPWVDLQSNEEYEEKLSAAAFQTILAAIAEKLGEARYYWHVFNPMDNTNMVLVCGDLLDGISDIYKDLKYSLMIYGLGKTGCEENALWQLKADFETHWSLHCINALSAIHFCLKQ